MIEKNPLIADRVREIRCSFAWVSHRFLRQGFWASLAHHELLLYLFLILVADRQGLSYYSFDKICSLLAISPDEYILARNALIDKDLIAFDGHLFQVLSLPARPAQLPSHPLTTRADMAARDPVTIRRIIDQALGGECR
ncbi:MAG: hypothetical protein OEV23_04430 [Gallionella sp.]|jgi:hypothetical protein|nr:hypothetical protein [Gallionella sp.]